MTSTRYRLYMLGLSIIGTMGVLICALWYPFSTAVNMGYIMPDAIVNLPAFYGILAFYMLCSVPCFIIVGMLMYGVRHTYMYGDNGCLARMIHRSIKIFSIDVIMFFVGNITLSIFELNTYAVIYYVLILIGIVVLIVGRCLEYRLEI